MRDNKSHIGTFLLVRDMLYHLAYDEGSDSDMSVEKKD